MKAPGQCVKKRTAGARASKRRREKKTQQAGRESRLPRHFRPEAVPSRVELEVGPRLAEVDKDVVRVRVAAVELRHEPADEPEGLAGPDFGAPEPGVSGPEEGRVAVVAPAVVGHDGAAEADDGDREPRLQALDDGDHLLEVRRGVAAVEEALVWGRAGRAGGERCDQQVRKSQREKGGSGGRRVRELDRWQLTPPCHQLEQWAGRRRGPLVAAAQRESGFVLLMVSCTAKRTLSHIRSAKPCAPNVLRDFGVTYDHIGLLLLASSKNAKWTATASERAKSRRGSGRTSALRRVVAAARSMVLRPNFMCKLFSCVRRFREVPNETSPSMKM